MYFLPPARLIWRAHLWLSLLFLPCLASADPGLPYEQLPGQLQWEQNDRTRVPQVEFQSEPLSGATLLKETDYRGEGQFPLVFTRIRASPQFLMTENCDSLAGMRGWIHSYSSCLIDHLNYDGPSSNRTLTVCTLGVCTMFEETLKPRSKDVRDTLVANGVINGTSYRWVYTHFQSGIREAYNGLGNLVARFDRSGIEHRVVYQSINGFNRISTVTHVPSGRVLRFQYNQGWLVSMTDPAGQIYAYNFSNNSNTVTFPAATAGAMPLVRHYTQGTLTLRACYDAGGIENIRNAYTYLHTVSEGERTLLDTTFNWPCSTNFPTYSRIEQAGHNAKNRVQQRSILTEKLTEQFADSDTADYRSLVYNRTFTQTNATDIRSPIYRPKGVSLRCADCDGDFKTATYNAKGDLLSRTDYLGRVTTFTRDPRGLPLTEMEAAGTPEARATTRTWDSRFPLKTAEVRGAVAKDWRYNDRGHLIKEIVRPATETLAYDSCRTGSTTCHQTVYSHTYDPTTQVIVRTVKTGPRPENGSTVTDYRNNGDLWKTTDALGRVGEVVGVDAHGHVTDQVDITGVHTVTTYNALGQPLSVAVGEDVTRYAYATDGRLQTLTRPDGSQLNYTYTPAGSVKTVSLSANGRTDTVAYQRDSRGKILQTLASQTGQAAQRWEQGFDERGRLISERDGSGSWSSVSVYNDNNLETRTCLSLEICDLTGYTALDQINEKTRAPMADDHSLALSIPLFDLWYDPAGRVNRVVDPNGVETRLSHTELDRHDREDSADFGLRQADFDLAGNETYREDPDGYASDKTYDPLDRLQRAAYSDNGVLAQTWDVPTLAGEPAASALGRLTGRSRLNAAAEGNLTVNEAFRYNARGDVTGYRQSLSGRPDLTFTTAYTAGADAAGKPTRIDYPGGLTITYRYGTDGRATEVLATLGATTLTLATDIRWQPLIHRLSRLTFGNGLTYTRERDAGGRLSAVTLTQGASALYRFPVGYDARNRVTVYGPTTFAYDDLDHLAEHRDTTRTLLRHDANGNLEQVQQLNASGVPLANNHLVYIGNRLIQETQMPAPAEGGLDGSNGPYRYDLSGYVTGHGKAVQFGYDAARNLTRYTRNGLTTRYVYDGHRRRALKLASGSETRYVYDGQDHLLYELAANGSRCNYVWLGDIPLAVIDQNAAGALTAAYAIETDFANTPRYLRSALPNVNLSQPVWAWPLAPYGNAPAQQDPDNNGSQVVFNLRYPGQYYDAESGLHYNHTRYFSPRTGRYLQPDLIKLEGGVNVYTYANGNPVHYTDPTGTFGVVGAFFGGLFDFSFQMLSNGFDIGAVSWGEVGASAALGGVGGVGVGTLGKMKKVVDKAGDVTKSAADITRRPSSFRKQTVQDAWDNATTGSKPGSKACPTCSKDVEVAPTQGRRDWDVDHQPKWSERSLSGMDRKQVLDEYNKDVRLRCPSCNRSDN
ncbi:RHS repeat-associated core domain-containing protein [Methylomicrobium agile]|uniref:RHS repeat-associated core domain-containing protein n=1 Tax=Methylomicrobium agile TaxID=39774 RepID=UPI0004DFB9B7|nr:RHS repeat-associated core domain-containing protein [Methylomicrobium agile]